jgi:PTH1 family peptidyl-tRNA hydrolase
MKIIIGLGNPGEEYSKTRHNLGFMVLNALRDELGFPRWKKEKLYEVTRGFVDDEEIVLAKPRTYMNLSGNAALSLMTTFHAKPEDLLVVYDEMALPFGKIRLRPSGSAGGHKGIGSILERVGREDVPRLRIGIGNPSEEEDSVNFVLSEFNQEEKKQLPEIIKISVESILSYLKEGINETMSRYN